MRFLKSYFDEDSSLKKLNNEFLEYENYLEKNRDCFDEQTYHILKNGMINDYTIEKFSMDIFWDEHDQRLANIEMILEYDEKRFLCKYEAVYYFSLQKDFNEEFGFDAILISECIVLSNGFEHYLYFVNNVPMVIKCKTIKIYRLSD